MSRKAPKYGHQRAVTKPDAEFGTRLRALRMDRGMSQDELGRLIGVSFQQIQKYEKGANRVSLTRAKQMATVLKTELHQLSGEGSGAMSGTALFDSESYKLAKVFTQLPDTLKPKLRSLINAIIGEQD